MEETGGYRGKIRMALQRSYRSHYRSMLPNIFDKLEFRCTNPSYNEILKALELIKTYFGRKGTQYPKHVFVPIKGIVPSSWESLGIDKC